jgi:hypothetical protein
VEAEERAGTREAGGSEAKGERQSGKMVRTWNVEGNEWQVEQESNTGVRETARPTMQGWAVGAERG